MKRRTRTATVSLAPFRRLMLLAVILAVSLQAYFVQTHIHGRPLDQAGAGYAAALKAPAAPLPADPMDPATCKLCQELVHATAILSAGPGLGLLSGWFFITAPPAHLPAAALASSTGWQSRAPPRR
jgi:hypothetical protein